MFLIHFFVVVKILTPILIVSSPWHLCNLCLTFFYYVKCLIRYRYAFNNIELLKWFLANCADLNKRCCIWDCTPPSYAVRSASFEVIELLFCSGGSAKHGQLLHYALMRELPDSFQVLKYIYDKSPNLCTRNINKLLDQDYPKDFAINYRAGLKTPLYYATLYGPLDSIKFLVENKADPEILDPYRRSAFGWAIYNNRESVAQFLKGLLKPVTSQQQRLSEVSIVT